ncbi:MAG: PilN domain-containing protein [Phycisphaeraceae bacterium]
MNSINFLPPSFFRAALRKRRRIWELAIVGTVLVAVVGGYFLLSDQSRAARAKLVGITPIGSAALINLKEKKQLEERKQILVDRLSAFRAMASPVTATQILASISELQDESIGLTELIIDGKVPTPRAKPDPKAAEKTKKAGARRGSVAPPPRSESLRISITGFAPDDAAVTGFVGRMSQHPLFADVKLEFSRSSEMGDLIGRGFTISARVSLDCEYKSPVLKGSVTDAN